MQWMQLTLENKPIKNCAFTGHRELDESFSLEKLQKTVLELAKKGAENFFCGMAKGFDLFAAEAVLKIKENYPKVKLVACVPYYGQEKGYSQEDKKRYVNILKNCDFKITFADEYYKGCTLVRDKYMADNADVLVAYLKKEKGGTAYTVGYFNKKYPEKEIIFLD